MISKIFRLCLLVGAAGWLSACAPPSPAAPLSPPSATASPRPSPTPTRASPTPDPTSTPSPPPCAETHGTNATLEVSAAGLARPLLARVHLPPCYAAAGGTRYPVLYLIHGQGFNSDQWERLGAPEALDRLTLAGEIAPLILVLPEEADTSANPFESPFGAALSDALVPAVDGAYVTCARRECRAIGGLSRGASWAVLLALTHPDLFAFAGAHSFPPFNGLDRRLQELNPAQPPLIYIDIGVRDPYRAAAAAFETLLNQADIPHEWYLNEGRHDEAYWSAHVEEYLRWYARQFAQAPAAE